MELLGFGDSLPVGTFDLHSAFGNALNFRGRSFMISLVNRKTGNGPFNIVVKQLPPGARRIRTTKFYLYIDENRLAFDPEKAYDSALPLVQADPGMMHGNLTFLKAFIARHARRKSLRFLFDAAAETDFTRLFEKTMARRVKKAVALLQSGEYAKGARALRGLGFGLTPSGDDFLSGYLTGLGFMELNMDAAVAGIKEAVYKNASTRNLIANSFLTCAYEGLVNEKIKELLHSLADDGKKRLAAAAKAALKSGHSSGADFCAGLVYGCEAGLAAACW